MLIYLINVQGIFSEKKETEAALVRLANPAELAVYIYCYLR